MLVKFIIVLLVMTATGVENEGGREALEEKGLKASLEAVIEQRETVDYTKMNE